MTITKEQLQSIAKMLKSDEDTQFLALQYLSIIDDYQNNAYLRAGVKSAEFCLKKLNEGISWIHLTRVRNETFRYIEDAIQYMNDPDFLVK